MHRPRGGGRRGDGVNGFLRLAARELRLSLRAGSDAATAIMFFVVTVALFPLGLGPEPNLLARMAAAVIWVAALLASLLALERLFRDDYEDGGLDLLVLSPVPLELAVLAKAAAHWLTTGVPLILVAPVLGILLDLPDGAYPALTLTLLLGTPSLSLLGAIGAALVLGARRAGALVALLILPLTVPVLIFAVSAIDAAAMGLPARPHLLLLGGVLALTLTLAPLAAAAALRQALR